MCWGSSSEERVNKKKKKKKSNEKVKIIVINADEAEKMKKPPKGAMIVDMKKIPFPDLNPPAVVTKGFRVKKKIGAGGFSQVHSAEKLGEPDPEKKRVAVKIMKYTDVDKGWQAAGKMKDEMKISRKLDNENVVKVLEIVKTNNRCFIFMERAVGSLDEELKKYPNKRLPDKEAKKYFKQAVNGVKYLHSKGVAHRDIKTDNFLIGKDGKLKLTDCGFATFIKDKITLKTKMSGTKCGSAGYWAPEVIDGRSLYNAYQSDMFSLGVVLYQILTGKLPYCDKDESNEKKYIYEARRKLWKANIPDDVKISSGARDLIGKLLDPEPTARPTAGQVLQHSWLADA